MLMYVNVRVAKIHIDKKFDPDAEKKGDMLVCLITGIPRSLRHEGLTDSRNRLLNVECHRKNVKPKVFSP